MTITRNILAAAAAVTLLVSLGSTLPARASSDPSRMVADPAAASPSQLNLLLRRAMPGGPMIDRRSASGM